MYQILMRNRALKMLAKMPVGDRRRVLGRLDRLGENPDRRDIDIRPLRGHPGYRLRVGRWRVTFSRDDTERKISVLQVRARGDAY